MTKQEDRVRAQKHIARSHFSALRRNISGESRELLDYALFSNTVSLPAFIESDVILCYYPVKSEPDILPLIRHALAIGKRVAFPISHKEDSRLTFHAVSDLSQLVVGAYGIPEPDSSLPEVLEFSNAFCIVPALAYDSKGNRLGYGGGYYDRFLSGYDGVSALLIYSALFSDELPTDDYDQRVDMIITEKGGVFNG